MNESGLIDIHCHILPGVDDGSKSMEQSIEMLRMAQEDGISHIILTPHFRDEKRSASVDKILTQFEELQYEVAKENIDITLSIGSELYYSRDLSDYVADKKALTMANREGYILVEFNPMEEFSYIQNALLELIYNDLSVILAHAERYEHLFDKKENIDILKRNGILFQLNASSVTGKTGHVYKKRCKELLKKEYADFIATDAHDTQKRAPYLQECAKYIRKKYGEEYYVRLFQTNPKAILVNEEI